MGYENCDYTSAIVNLEGVDYLALVSSTCETFTPEIGAFGVSILIFLATIAVCLLIFK
jgi:hypothetical protein